MDVECKRKGSVQDAKVFANSAVCNKLHSGQIPHAVLNLLPGYDSLPSYLNWDTVYPLALCWMREFHTCLKNKQVFFSNIKKTNWVWLWEAQGQMKSANDTCWLIIYNKICQIGADNYYICSFTFVT